MKCMSKLQWRIYYGDFTTYTNLDGIVYNAPPLNVQAVAYFTDDPNVSKGYLPIFRFDYYWYELGEWYGGEIFGLMDYLMRQGPKKVLFGRTIPTADHQKIVNLACNDPDFING